MYRCEVQGCTGKDGKPRLSLPGKAANIIRVMREAEPGFSPRKPDSPIRREEIEREVKACTPCFLSHQDTLRKLQQMEHEEEVN